MWSLIRAMVRAGTPLLLGTVGEVLTERSGVLNLGVEGMMAAGAVSAFAVAYRTGSAVAGLAAAAAAGALLALIHAAVSVTLRGNQVVCGLSIAMLGLGLSSLVGRRYIGVPLSARFREVSLWGALAADPVAYGALLAAALTWAVLWKTRAGAVLRAVGDNPKAAEALGIRVHLVRYAATVTGGALAGVAGGYLPLAYTPSWIEGMTGGRGWIVIGLTVFSFWSPGKAVLGAYMFGLIEALAYRLQPLGVSAPLLMALPYLAAVLALLAGSREEVRKKAGVSALGKPYPE